jgi:hypothetical protein
MTSSCKLRTIYQSVANEFNLGSFLSSAVIYYGNREEMDKLVTTIIQDWNDGDWHILGTDLGTFLKFVLRLQG